MPQVEHNYSLNSNGPRKAIAVAHLYGFQRPSSHTSRGLGRGASKALVRFGGGGAAKGTLREMSISGYPL